VIVMFSGAIEVNTIQRTRVSVEFGMQETYLDEHSVKSPTWKSRSPIEREHGDKIEM